MTFKVYSLRVYVGPTSVDHYAAMAKAAGFGQVFAGTQHVWLTTSPISLENETDRLVLRQKVADTIYGRRMAAAWRDVEIVRAL